jgi:hypothetical protein
MVTKFPWSSYSIRKIGHSLQLTYGHMESPPLKSIMFLWNNTKKSGGEPWVNHKPPMYTHPCGNSLYHLNFWWNWEGFSMFFLPFYPDLTSMWRRRHLPRWNRPSQAVAPQGDEGQAATTDAGEDLRSTTLGEGNPPKKGGCPNDQHMACRSVYLMHMKI